MAPLAPRPPRLLVREPHYWRLRTSKAAGGPGRRPAGARRRRVVAPRLLLALLLGALGLALLAPAAAAQAAGQVAAQQVAQQSGAGEVLMTRAEGPITPVIADHLVDALAAARAGGYQMLLVEMDTPGGLDTSMRVIVQTFLTAEVPVVVYVSPAGARAASAGAIIAFSAHVAAMAPGTNIGAATPIDLEGGEVIDKVINDAAAYVEAIAEARDRDVDFAVDTVREGRSASANAALEAGAIDLIVADQRELFDELDGRTVQVKPEGTEVTLETAGANVDEFEMSFTRRILQALANPQLAFLLLSVGTLALIYELASPGGIIGGVIGVIMLILAFFSLAVLPVDLVGVLLLLLALALFAAELFVPGVGVFAGGGAIALVFAGLFLFQRPTGVGIDLAFLIPVAVAVGLVAVVIGRFAVRSIRRPAYRGSGGEVVGQTGTVRQAAGSSGKVWLNGTMWRAHSTGAPLRLDEQVRVVEMRGLELVVEPLVTEERR
jgi:membrane-bound serine protease (ClpP class)